MQRQCEDVVLGRIRKELQEAGNREAGDGKYVMDDNVTPLVGSTSGKGSMTCSSPISRSGNYGAGAQHLWASRDGENYSLD